MTEIGPIFVDSSLFAAFIGRAVSRGFVPRFAASSLAFHALLLLPFPPYAVHPRGEVDCRMRPSLLHRTSMRMSAFLHVILFVNVSLVSLFQFPLVPDGSRGGVWLVRLARLLGIEKLGSNSMECSSSCSSNEIHYLSIGDASDRPGYWTLAGMGVYALLLVASFVYVALDGRFNRRKRSWRAMGTSDCTTAWNRIPR